MDNSLKLILKQSVKNHQKKNQNIRYPTMPSHELDYV